MWWLVETACETAVSNVNDDRKEAGRRSLIGAGDTTPD